MKVKILQAADDQFYWHTVALNGRITASGSGYNTRQEAKRAWARHVCAVKKYF
jgi:uncharacterized protein YegP (UPF0339 family)